MKKIARHILAVILIISISGVGQAFAFPQEDVVKQCMEAWAKNDTTQMGNIENPINKRKLACRGETAQKVLYQGIVDIYFSEVDVKVEAYLKSLLGTKKPIESLMDMRKKLGISGEPDSFYNQYRNVCITKWRDSAMEFIEKNVKYGLSSSSFSAQMYNGDDCQGLFQLKLAAYYDAGELIIDRETVNSFEKARKDFMREVKNKYRVLLFKVMTYLGQLKVISGKWYVNTKNPSN